MKKNKMMRLASVLLIVVLMTTSVVGGTFAKYVTTNGGTDTAQVAKFGVQINIADDLGLFNTEYAKTDSKYTGTVSVKNEVDTQLVAPGTKGSMSFTITGKPEVATRVSIDFDTTCNAIQLAAGEYTLPAGYFAATETKVTTTAVYEPVKFYFGTAAITDATAYTLDLAGLQSAMNTAFTQDYNPGHEFGKDGETYYLGWSWAFEDASNANADFLDTYLGYQAATATAQKEILKFDITVTQID